MSSPDAAPAHAVKGELPRAGRYAVTNGAELSELHTAGRALRKRYRDDFLRGQQSLTDDLKRLGIPLLQARTNESPFGLLQQFYGERQR